MKAETCQCPAENFRSGEHLSVRGKTHLILTLNLRDFIEAQSREDFERLRGGIAFTEQLRRLKPRAGSPFQVNADEDDTIERGYEFSVFCGHLKEQWLFPTFKLDKACRPAEPALAEEWDKFDCNVRLSRMGLLEIKLTRAFPSAGGPETEPLIEMLRDLLEIRSRFHAVEPIQWRLGLYCANQFIQALPSQVEMDGHDDSPDPVTLHFRQVDIEQLPRRQRYTILFFDLIRCETCGKRIEAQDLWNKAQGTVRAILEGALVEVAPDQCALPSLYEKSEPPLTDLATWESELCVFAPERCLIYYSPARVFLSALETLGQVDYEKYWKCIVRGIEHTITVRTALHILEAHTTGELDTVPLLTKKVTDGEVTTQDEREILQMAQKLSNTFNMLPPLRDVLVPTSAFRASYAVNKFAHLNQVLYLDQSQAHVQRNVDELTSFLEYFKSTQLQQELGHEESAINWIGVLIAVSATLIAAPSFLQDFTQYFDGTLQEPKSLALEIFAALLLFLLVAVMLYYNLRRRRKQVRASASGLKRPA